MGVARTGVLLCDLQLGQSIVAHMLLPGLARGLLAPDTLLGGDGCLQAQAHTAVTCTEGSSMAGRSQITL